MKKLASALICAGFVSIHAGAAWAAVSAEEARKLGSELTPIGAEKAGSKDGAIPAYTGGLTTPPAGFDKAKGVRPDPFASEKPLMSIDAKSMDKYSDKLTEGTKALMKAHAEFRIDVYPTHRTVAMPQNVLDNTVKNATRGKLAENGLGFSGARGGYPFPIPKNGNEAMFNHIARWQGLSYFLPKYSAYNVDASGKLLIATQGSWRAEVPFYDDSNPSYPTVIVRATSRYTGPARRAGEAVMTTDFNDSTSPRRVYQYLPGQRRVRLAPDLSYDAPNASTGGMSTVDDINIFNGRQDRFDFTLVGKKEMYVPYNAYRMVYNPKPEDVFKSKFVSPDVMRWELHRVWVVEAKLKEGARHIYSRRTFYLDEDSWTILASDQYDARGQLWRPGFAYLTQNYDMASPSTIVSGHYDLIAGTYYVNSWPGANGMVVQDKMLPDSDWTADSMAAQGVR